MISWRWPEKSFLHDRDSLPSMERNPMRVGPCGRLFPKMFETVAYFNLELPSGPAMMAADAIVFKGANISWYGVEAFICCRLVLFEQEKEKKDPPGGIPGR
jgi:hypothetical protein